jgi:methyltransferase (TIGR00027 family)
MSNGVSRTSLTVAAHRARETERDGALFMDPFARRLAGTEGFAAAEEIARASGLLWRHDVPSMFALRTRFFDDAARDAVARQQIHQVVIVGAGMDTRSYRIQRPAGTRLFEVDRPEAFDHKRPILDSTGARPHCELHIVPADLRDDWIASLIQAGFDANATTLWIVEGIIYYLAVADAHRLLDDIATHCSPGSTLLVDVAPTLMRDLPELQPWRDALTAMGEPFQSFTDDGRAFLAPHGWEADARSIADVAQDLGYTVEAIGSLGVPRLLCARKR